MFCLVLPIPLNYPRQTELPITHSSVPPAISTSVVVISEWAGCSWLWSNNNNPAPRAHIRYRQGSFSIKRQSIHQLKGSSINRILLCQHKNVLSAYRLTLYPLCLSPSPLQSFSHRINTSSPSFTFSSHNRPFPSALLIS